MNIDSSKGDDAIYLFVVVGVVYSAVGVVYM